MPTGALQSYGNNTACPNCVHVDPERLDLHIAPRLPRMHASMLACYTTCHAGANRSRLWRHTARGSFYLLEIDIATKLGLHLQNTT